MNKVERAAKPLFIMMDKHLHEINSCNPRWNTFVRDHIDYLIDRSEKIVFDREYGSYFNYDLEGFLRDRFYDTKYTRVVRIVNDILTNRDFYYPDYIYLPDTQEIDNLYALYKTIYSEHK